MADHHPIAKAWYRVPGQDGLVATRFNRFLTEVVAPLEERIAQLEGDNKDLHERLKQAVEDGYNLVTLVDKHKADNARLVGLLERWMTDDKMLGLVAETRTAIAGAQNVDQRGVGPTPTESGPQASRRDGGNGNGCRLSRPTT